MEVSDLRIGDRFVGLKKGLQESRALYTVVQTAPEERCICVEVNEADASRRTTALRWDGDAFHDVLDDIQIELKFDSVPGRVSPAEEVPARYSRDSHDGQGPIAPERTARINRRSSPDHRQVSATVLKSTANEVKARLAHLDKDFSTLLEELLEKWLSDSFADSSDGS